MKNVQRAKENWNLLDGLTKRQQYMLLLELTQDLSSRKMNQLVRRHKLLTIDAAFHSAAFRFKHMAGAV
jgi:hypothetical protein